mgnify:CR=1 FL=1
MKTILLLDDARLQVMGVAQECTTLFLPKNLPRSFEDGGRPDIAIEKLMFRHCSLTWGGIEIWTRDGEVQAGRDIRAEIAQGLLGVDQDANKPDPRVVMVPDDFLDSTSMGLKTIIVLGAASRAFRVVSVSKHCSSLLFADNLPRSFDQVDLHTRITSQEFRSCSMRWEGGIEIWTRDGLVESGRDIRAEVADGLLDIGLADRLQLALNSEVRPQ